MKKKSLFSVMLALLPMVAWCNDGDVFKAKTVEGIEMTFQVISEEEKTARVFSDIEFVGESMSGNPSVSPSTAGTVTIPEKANGYSITGIGYRAFFGCQNITNAVLNNSIERIGAEAFMGCTLLQEVKLPSTLVYLGQLAFYGCKSLKAITLPKNLTEIVVGPETPFAYSGLESIFVEKGNKKYDSRENCNAVIEKSSNTIIIGCAKTTFPKDIVAIGNDAFKGSKITSLNIPEGITFVGARAFMGCNDLKSISLPESLTTLFSNAFEETAWWESQNDGLVYLGDFAFRYKSNSQIYPSIVEIKEGTKYLSDGLFENFYYHELKSIKLPNSVERIGSYAFYGQSALPEVDLPANLQYIGESAFKYCKNLKIKAWPKGLRHIGDGAFQNCMSMDNAIFVEETGTCVFSSCDNIKSIEIAENVKEISFNGITSAVLEKVTFPNTIESVTGFHSSGIVETPWYQSLPEGIFYAGKSALTYIGKYNVSRPLVINEGTEIIGSEAFLNQIELTDVELPSSLKKVCERAFENCTNLTSQNIPANVNSISKYIVRGCDKLEFIKSFITDIENTKVDWNAFSYSNWNNGKYEEIIYSNVPLYIPAGLKKAYEKTSFGRFEKIVEMEKNPSGTINYENGNIATDINGVSTNNTTNNVVNSYTIDGSSADKRHKGLHIVRMSDGSVRKLITK